MEIGSLQECYWCYRLFNLKLGKLNKYLFQGCSGNCKVKDSFILELQSTEFLENLTQTSIFFNHLVCLLDLIECLSNLISSSLVILINFTTLFLDKEWHQFVHLLVNLCLVDNVLKWNGVSLTICWFQVSRATITNKSTIDHDSNFITQRFSFIHSMSCKYHRRILKTFQHFE